MHEPENVTHMRCHKCRYEWDSKSQMYFVSCPRCGAKVRRVPKGAENGQGS